MNATSTNITDTALITDAELADFLSDCTDSHPNTPEHEVTYQEDEQDVAPFDALDIPFALPVHNKMVAVNADGSAIDFSIGYGGAVGSDSAQKSAKQDLAAQLAASQNACESVPHLPPLCLLSLCG